MKERVHCKDAHSDGGQSKGETAGRVKMQQVMCRHYGKPDRLTTLYVRLDVAPMTRKVDRLTRSPSTAVRAMAPTMTGV